MHASAPNGLKELNSRCIGAGKFDAGRRHHASFIGTGAVLTFPARKLHGTSCLHSEQRHESGQSGYPHASLADVGCRNREHHRDRAAARPYPARDHPSAAAARGAHWKSDLHPRGPPAISDSRRRDSLELRALDRRFSRRNVVAARFSGHRRPRRARHPRPLCRLHAPLDPQDFPQSLSARSAGAELLTLDTACRMREARRGR